MTSPDPFRTPTPAVSRRRAPWRRLVAFAAFAAAGLLIASREIPQLGAWIERTLQPDRYRAHEACLAAALGANGEPEFSRLLRRGQVHDTSSGFYVENLVIGERAGGAENRMLISCYVDRGGAVVDTQRSAVPDAAKSQATPGEVTY